MKKILIYCTILSLFFSACSSDSNSDSSTNPTQGNLFQEISSSSLDDISSSVSEILDSTTLADDSSETREDFVFVDTTIIPMVKNGSLEAYLQQFSLIKEGYSFDSRVLVYQGENLRTSQPDIDIKEGVHKIDFQEVSKLYPLLELNYKVKENCELYMVVAADGMQPMGHVLTNISSDSISVAIIERNEDLGGDCRKSLDYLYVGFLFESCDGLDYSKVPIKTHVVTSPTWKCSDSSQTINAYGLWYRRNFVE